MTVLNQMNDWLLSCESREEAYAVIAYSARLLFAGHAGGLAIYDDTTQELQVTARWGDSDNLPVAFTLHDCWALRRGELYAVTDPVQDIHCHHFHQRPEQAYLCLPLMVRRDTLGLLHLSTGSGLSQVVFQDLRALAITASESIKLALFNLKLRDALREQATHDPLTGLFNRRYLDDTLPRELRRHQRYKEPLVAAMLDLDHFKRFNDTYGHEAGDTVLRAVGELLRNSLRASDIACRYGGEELTIVMPGSTLNDAQIRLDHLRHSVMQLHLGYRDQELPTITVSIGVAAAEPEETDATAMLGRADTALYQAKEQGRNRVVVASESA